MVLLARGSLEGRITQKKNANVKNTSKNIEKLIVRFFMEIAPFNFVELVVKLYVKQLCLQGETTVMLAL